MPPFVKKMLTPMTICSLSILTTIFTLYSAQCAWFFSEIALKMLSKIASQLALPAYFESESCLPCTSVMAVFTFFGSFPDIILNNDELKTKLIEIS